MSKTISYRGQLDDGLEDKINLSTIKGKVGYKITKFQIMNYAPGYDNYETTVKIYTKSQLGSISEDVNFTESDMLAVAYIEDENGPQNPMSEVVIFDNMPFNQNIFVSAKSRTGTNPVNYYIELETMSLSDIEATMLTLKSIKNIKA